MLKGMLDEDGLVVAAVGFGDGEGDAELVGDLGSGIGEESEVQAVLLEHEDVLAWGFGGRWRRRGRALRRRSSGWRSRQVSSWGDAVRIPSATEEAEDEGAECE